MILELREIVMSLGKAQLELNLTLNLGTTVIFGPSGAGKTSLLDLIAGLRQAASGRIQLGPDILVDTRQSIRLPARLRKIGYVPQDLALFPHLSVQKNISYGYNATANPRFAFGTIVELFEIGQLLGRGVRDLSGGEKQRVALARALLSSPRLLLLDEPLASLDLPLKARIIPYLNRVRNELELPIIYVTHDRFETLSLADTLVVLIGGKVAQHGPVHEVFRHPANLDVAGMLTVETIHPGRVLREDDELVTLSVNECNLCALRTPATGGSRNVHVCIRAEDVILLRNPDTPSSARNHLQAKILEIKKEGALMRIELDCGFPLTAVLTRQSCMEMDLMVGDSVVALVKAPNIHLIAR